MEEMDTDEYLTMLEEEARTRNPEEEYQMYAAYLFGSLREDLDELERFIADLIAKMKHQSEKPSDGDQRTRAKESEHSLSKAKARGRLTKEKAAKKKTKEATKAASKPSRTENEKTPAN